MQFPQLRLSLFFCLVLLLSSAAPLSALSVVVPTFSDLVTKSDQIVRGQVVRVESRRTTNAAGYELIKTFVSIRPTEIPKGESSSAVVLSFLGGSVAGEKFEIPGMPKFKKGDRAWFFIKGNGSTLCPLISGPHGAYREVKDPTTNELRVVRYDGSAMASPEAIERPPVNQDSVRSLSASPPLTPAIFRAAIYRELDRLPPPLLQQP